MELSARNQLPGVVTDIKLDGVMAEVIIKTNGGEEVVSAVTRASVERLGIAVGDEVVAVIKATEVLIGTKSKGS